MLDTLGRNWWVLLVRGIAATLFGVLAILWPDITVEAVVLVFGVFALADGIFEVIGIIRHTNESESRAVRGLRAAVSMIAGIVALVWPAITALALLYVIAAWALIIGALEIYAAVRLRRQIEGEWLLGLGGLLSIAFGVVAIIFPGAGILSLIWLVGAYAILFGITLIVLAFQVRGWYREYGEGAQG